MPSFSKGNESKLLVNGFTFSCACFNGFPQEINNPTYEYCFLLLS